MFVYLCDPPAVTKTMRLILLLFIFCSCGKKERSASSPEIIALYSDVNRLRFSESDSLLMSVNKLDAAVQNSNKTYKAMAAIGRGIHYNKIAAYRQSVQSYELALQLLKDDPIDSLLGKAYVGIGNAYKNMTDHPAALENLQTALEHFEKQNESLNIAGVHSNLAQIYQLKNDLPQAKKHIRRSLDLLKDNKNSSAWLIAAHTLANVHGMSNELDSAMAIDREGIQVARQSNHPLLITPFLDNIANCYMYSNRPDSARYYFHQCLAIDSASGNFKQVADTYLNLGMLAAMQKDHKAAEQNFLKGEALANQVHYRYGVVSAWKSLSALYKNSGDHQKALDAHEHYVKVKDSTVNEKTEARLAELETIYETSKKEQQIAIQSATIEKQRAITGAIIVGVIALILLSYSFYRRYKLKQVSIMEASLFKQRQEATIQILEAEEKERQRIASDLHDGVGQAMTAAWLNLQAIDRLSVTGSEEESLIKTTTNLVGNSCAEIREISHNLMPSSLASKGLVDSVKEFTSQLNTQLSVSINATREKFDLPQSTELILYRVIQECVNNVLKHAQATRLDISISIDAGELDLLIEDDGKGFETENSFDGIGLQNIRSRIHYLNGSVSWDSTPEGTVVAIHIPIEK